MIPILTTCNPLCVACRNVSSSFPSSYSVVFPQSIFYFCLSPLLFSASSFLNIFGQLFLSGCTLLFAASFLLFSCVPSSCHLFLFPPLLPRLPLLSLFPLLSLHCCSSSTTFCRLSSSSSSSPPWWLRVNSWRCCSIASVCPACRANPTPHQALGPSTPTKYFYLFIHPRPSGASWR